MRRAAWNVRETTLLTFHIYGLAHFPVARWLAAAPVAALLNASGKYTKTVEDAPELLMGEIDLLHTPGHTFHHYSLRFDWEGRSVVIAADAAVTRDYWRERQGYFNSEDFMTIDRIAGIADLIVPGHDNYFFVKNRQ